jgi:cell division protein FtsQ
MADKLKSLVLKWWPVFMWTLIALATGLSLAFVKTEQREIACIKLIINHLDERNAFIDNGDILQMLSMKNLNPVGKPLNEINTALLENIINANPYVANTEVFSTIDGKVYISIKQRNPVVRIINQAGENYYIDDSGKLMPVSAKYTADVLVANGSIFDIYNNKTINTQSDTVSDVLSQIFYVAAFLQNDTVLNNMFTQLYFTNNNQMELVPRIGSHIVQIGDATALADKMKKLMVFYKKGLNKTGWDTYSTINVQYNNQVVCTRKQNQIL